ncbi:MAG: hypothetical protein K2X35_15835, partial [Bryobacteraceae bacterium]|nr:hypothetical protein [Bryobacteraceae bacterium]
MNIAPWVLLTFVVWLGTASGQAPPDLERRIFDLERKMKTLDPSFAPATERMLVQRLQDLESKMEELLAARSSSAVAALAPAQPPTSQPSTPAVRSAPLQPVSITGDFQTSPDTETRLPVTGYMDFHVNKESGDS